jgi:iron-sulfur cluster insertion protein
MITITEKAKTKIFDILVEEENNVNLRVFVQGGGCAGFSYGFSMDESKNEDDFEFKVDKFSVIVDAMSMQYLSGSAIDYKETLMGSNFTIENPNVESTCGCGSSFSINTYNDYEED